MRLVAQYGATGHSRASYTYIHRSGEIYISTTITAGTDLDESEEQAGNTAGKGRKLVIVESPKKAQMIAGFLGKEYDGRQIDTSLDLADYILEKAEVALVPGEAFGPSGYVRLSYALGDEQLIEGVKRLQKLFGAEG